MTNEMSLTTGECVLRTTPSLLRLLLPLTETCSEDDDDIDSAVSSRFPVPFMVGIGHEADPPRRPSLLWFVTSIVSKDDVLDPSNCFDVRDGASELKLSVVDAAWGVMV